MRIISGKFKSRRIKMVPSKDTRETVDKVKGAIFNSLGESIIDAEIIDLFAGAGSYGLEALSRGAKHVVFNDVKPLAQKTILENIHSLDLKSVTTLWKLDYQKAIEKIQNEDLRFDIVILDPPYTIKHFESMIDALKNHLNEAGIIVIETNKKVELDLNKIPDMIIKNERIYGNVKIIYVMKK